ncbi:MAG TPA: L-2-hydroxyglutarate oxidase [Patescibacteria group bacterium]|jgi:L-2-hydroxyglutarate oxidase LhgO|nr:L-2-hydroxyglutarate oxidase [Patescibacteria group bacterium]
MTESFDVTIVGGGIVGLATALRLQQRRPALTIAILEKEPELATHQTGHNSGVLHAGLYYQPGSRKARLCREGKTEMEAFAEAHDIPVDHCGKLVVAVDPSELARLDALRDRAVANGVPGLEVVDRERIRELEPHAAGIRGLWSPRTGVIDFRRVALSMADELRAGGAEIRTGHTVSAIDVRPSEVVVTTGRGDVTSRLVVTCAGLQADRVAALSGDTGGPSIVPFRGDYYTLSPQASGLVRGLIYPIPDPRFPFLGVHLTKRIDGSVIAGPNAVLAFAREGYRRRDVDARDLVAALTDRGFLRLAGRYLPTGIAEMWRDWSKSAFVQQLQRYVPELRPDQVTFGPSGVRAQALARNGTLVDDFAFSGGPRVLHVRNAPSPAATSSLAIGSVLADEAFQRLDAA